jgi:hypothetical protein
VRGEKRVKKKTKKKKKKKKHFFKENMVSAGKPIWPTANIHLSHLSHSTHPVLARRAAREVDKQQHCVARGVELVEQPRRQRGLRGVDSARHNIVHRVLAARPAGIEGLAHKARPRHSTAGPGERLYF